MNDYIVHDKHSGKEVSIKVGKHTYGCDGITLLHSYQGSKLSIGSFCSLGRELIVNLGGNHRTDWITSYPFGLPLLKNSHIFKTPSYVDKLFSVSNGDVIIGNDVWTGFDVKIMSGVKIGDGAVIATQSIVFESVKPYSIVAGNPAKLISYKFNQEIISKLLEIKWWDWPDIYINNVIPFLCSSNINKLIEYYELTKDKLKEEKI